MKARIVLAHGNEETLLFDGQMPIIPRIGELIRLSWPISGKADAFHAESFLRVHGITWSLVAISPTPDGEEPELVASASIRVHGFYEPIKAAEAGTPVERSLFPS